MSRRMDLVGNGTEPEPLEEGVFPSHTNMKLSLLENCQADGTNTKRTVVESF